MESDDKITEAGRVLLIMEVLKNTEANFHDLYNLTYPMGRREMTDTLHTIVNSKQRSYIQA